MERYRLIETQRQIKRETETIRQWQTDRERRRQRDRQTHRQKRRQRDKETDRQTESERERKRKCRDWRHPISSSLVPQSFSVSQSHSCCMHWPLEHWYSRSEHVAAHSQQAPLQLHHHHHHHHHHHCHHQQQQQQEKVSRFGLAIRR